MSPKRLKCRTFPDFKPFLSHDQHGLVAVNRNQVNVNVPLYHIVFMGANGLIFKFSITRSFCFSHNMSMIIQVALETFLWETLRLVLYLVLKLRTIKAANFRIIGKLG